MGLLQVLGLAAHTPAIGPLLSIGFNRIDISVAWDLENLNPSPVAVRGRIVIRRDGGAMVIDTNAPGLIIPGTTTVPPDQNLFRSVTWSSGAATIPGGGLATLAFHLHIGSELYEDQGPMSVWTFVEAGTPFETVHGHRDNGVFSTVSPPIGDRTVG